MRIVADSNIIVSGLLWRGLPRQVLDLARAREIQLFTSGQLLAELDDVLRRRKFRRRLEMASTSPAELVAGYAALASVIRPAVIDPVILADPDDDAVVACAIAATARWIVSGDHHLLDLRSYRGIRIGTARELLRDGLGSIVTERS